MTLTAKELYDKLTEIDNDSRRKFTLRVDVTESDIQAWCDNIDTQPLRKEIDGQIESTVVYDLHSPAGIGPDSLSVAEVIESRGDDPSNYDAAYIIRSRGTVVQYFKPHVSGKRPISEEAVESEMEDHVLEMVTRATNSELISRAVAEFGD